MIVILVGLLATANLAHAQTATSPTPPPSPRHYDIAAFVWPSYHPDDRAKIFWPEGIGEWQTVKHNQPKFEGHDQPRIPLWGYVNEADPKVMAMQIAAAADHGVNVFIYVRVQNQRQFKRGGAEFRGEEMLPEGS